MLDSSHNYLTEMMTLRNISEKTPSSAAILIMQLLM